MAWNYGIGTSATEVTTEDFGMSPSQQSFVMPTPQHMPLVHGSRIAKGQLRIGMRVYGSYGGQEFRNAPVVAVGLLSYRSRANDFGQVSRSNNPGWEIRVGRHGYWLAGSGAAGEEDYLYFQEEGKESHIAPPPPSPPVYSPPASPNYPPEGKAPRGAIVRSRLKIGERILVHRGGGMVCAEVEAIGRDNARVRVEFSQSDWGISMKENGYWGGDSSSSYALLPIKSSLKYLPGRRLPPKPVDVGLKQFRETQNVRTIGIPRKEFLKIDKKVIDKILEKNVDFDSGRERAHTFLLLGKKNYVKGVSILPSEGGCQDVAQVGSDSVMKAIHGAITAKKTPMGFCIFRKRMRYVNGEGELIQNLKSWGGLYPGCYVILLSRNTDNVAWKTGKKKIVRVFLQIK